MNKYLTTFVDRNRDGYVDKADIVIFKRVSSLSCNILNYIKHYNVLIIILFSLIQRLKQYREQVDLQAVKEAYTVGYEDYWLLLQELADTNKDGKLSRFVFLY